MLHETPQIYLLCTHEKVDATSGWRAPGRIGRGNCVASSSESSILPTFWIMNTHTVFMQNGITTLRYATPLVLVRTGCGHGSSSSESSMIELPDQTPVRVLSKRWNTVTLTNFIKFQNFECQTVTRLGGCQAFVHRHTPSSELSSLVLSNCFIDSDH